MKRIVLLSAVAVVFVLASMVRAEEKKVPQKDGDVKKEVKAKDPQPKKDAEKRDGDVKKEVVAKDPQPKKDGEKRDAEVKKDIKAKDPTWKGEKVGQSKDAERRKAAPEARKDGDAARRAAAAKARAFADKRGPVRPEMRPPVRPGVRPPMRPGVRPPMRPGVRPPMRPGMQPPVRSAVQPEIAKRLLAHRAEMEKQHVQRLTQLLRRIQNVAREEKAEKTVGAIDRAVETVTQEARKRVAAQHEAAKRLQSRLSDIQKSRQAAGREGARRR